MIESLIDILQIDSDLNTGNDDFVFGSYMEWPVISTLDKSVLRELLDFFGVSFPFGENITLVEVLEMKNDLVEKTDIFDKIKFFNINKEELQFSEYTIKYPSIEDSRDEIAELLLSYGVPEGTVYEDAGDMVDYPSEYKYWPTKNESNDWEYYSEFAIENLNYTDKIEEIKAEIDISNGHEIRNKSLILSALVFTESFVKSKIVKGIPNKKEFIFNSHFYNIVDTHINKNLQTNNGRKDLYKEFYNKSLPAFPKIALRNHLAHDIGTTQLKKNRIVFNDKNGNEQQVSIESLFNELLDYPNLF